MAKIRKQVHLPPPPPPPPSPPPPLPTNIGQTPIFSDVYLKTLIFCTAFTEDHWGRYERWLKYIINSKLKFDQILIPDDGSPVLPTFSDCQIISDDLPDEQPGEKTVVYHWQEHLGKLNHLNYPGWFRSFMFIPTYAKKYEFKKIIHIESDAFLISQRIQDYINSIIDGWVTFWCPNHNFTEPAIQIIAGNGFDNYCQFSLFPYELFVDKFAEDYLPFTFINKEFIGDRYGEYMEKIPNNIDYACQIRLSHSL